MIGEAKIRLPIEDLKTGQLAFFEVIIDLETIPMDLIPESNEYAPLLATVLESAMVLLRIAREENVRG